ncbi:MAG TPA: PilZ domain-containing protein [Cellulomonas sp.]|uniref:PilZ domain-containing protein n=1 Tax=Cellulomonas sp. TaxID=40001 RepID=UPI002E377A24|nr:PilZ domain-containing protein [Cellulomonas sp.]HEX5332556.1 PilZ domain-containing protein [Cellulomonas sp.]
MHDLALCTVHVDGEVIVDGFVLEFAGDVLTVATPQLAVGLTPGDDVTVRVLDEVRGECLYAGFVSRVAPDQVDVADLGLVSTLQKREVVRVRVAIPCRGTVVPHLPVSAPDGAARPDGSTDGGADRGPGGATTATATVTEPATATGRRIDFTMLDVSAHGMRMLARVDLATGSLIRFRFEELDAPFVIDAIVVRGEESRTGTHYGCRFVGMTVRQTDSLFGYVLRTQGDQRRERLRAV